MPNINESRVNNADIKSILKTAAANKNKPTGLSKYIKGLRKDKIDVNDLQQSWKDEGYPDDTRDITQLLLRHGFSGEEIKKVFSEVFGTYKKGDGEDEVDVTTSSPTILKIANYIKENNLQQEVVEFMKNEYGFAESSSFGQKLVVEDIRKIFSAIVQENRSERDALIKLEDKENLGRTKK